MSEAKIKACPFCGKSPTVKQAGRTNYWWVGCEIHIGPEPSGCGVSHSDYDKSEAIRKWNKRAGGQQQEAAQDAGNIAGSISATGCAPFAISIIDAPAKCQKCGSRYVSPTTGKVRNDCHCGGELVIETLGHNDQAHAPVNNPEQSK